MPVAPFLSHRSRVSAWEKDRNNHWNTQFYLRAFQQASELVGATFAACRIGAESILLRHVRFYRELRDDDAFSIWSARSVGPDGTGHIIHLMRLGLCGEVCAAAIDAVGFDISALPQAEPEMIERACAKGLPFGKDEPVDAMKLCAMGAATVSQLSVIQPSELDHSGAFSAEALQARLMNGIPHVWDHIGAPSELLYRSDLGRVNVELKVSRFADVSAGQAVRLISWFESAGAKSVIIRHQLETVPQGIAIAGVATVTLVIDAVKRRAVDLPDFIRDAVEIVCSKVHSNG